MFILHLNFDPFKYSLYIGIYLSFVKLKFSNPALKNSNICMAFILIFVLWSNPEVIFHKFKRNFQLDKNVLKYKNFASRPPTSPP